MCKQTREEKLTQLDSFNQQPVILLPGGGSASQLMRMHSFQLQWINSNKSVGLHIKCIYAVCTYHYFKMKCIKLYIIYRCLEKCWFLEKWPYLVSTFKLIKFANIGGVLEKSGNLLHYEHWDFQNWRRNDWENEA